MTFNPIDHMLYMSKIFTFICLMHVFRTILFSSPGKSQSWLLPALGICHWFIYFGIHEMCSFQSPSPKQSRFVVTGTLFGRIFIKWCRGSIGNFALIKCFLNGAHGTVCIPIWSSYIIIIQRKKIHCLAWFPALICSQSMSYFKSLNFYHKTVICSLQSFYEVWIIPSILVKFV